MALNLPKTTALAGSSRNASGDQRPIASTMGFDEFGQQDVLLQQEPCAIQAVCEMDLISGGVLIH